MNSFTGKLLTIAILIGIGTACESGQDQPAVSETTSVQTELPQLKEVWSLEEGLNRPESVVFDAERDLLYVSNINGGPSEQDGTGYLSSVSTDGQLVEERWVTGLDAPKGLAISNGRLYVADVDELVEVDLSTGEIAARYTVEGAGMLNDVAAGPDGVVYVSDSQTHNLYRLQNGELSVWIEGGEILTPNGVHVVDDQLVVAAADSTAENPGNARYLQTISLDGSEFGVLGDRAPIGGLDAVEPDGRGGLFLSDWGAGTVMYFGQDSVSTLVTVSQGTADLEFVAETEMVYLPVMMSDRLIAYRVSYQ